MYDTWGLVAKKTKGHWRPFPKHTKSNCAPAAEGAPEPGEEAAPALRRGGAKLGGDAAIERPLGLRARLEQSGGAARVPHPQALLHHLAHPQATSLQGAASPGESRCPNGL